MHQEFTFFVVDAEYKLYKIIIITLHFNWELKKEREIIILYINYLMKKYTTKVLKIILHLNIMLNYTLFAIKSIHYIYYMALIANT